MADLDGQDRQSEILRVAQLCLAGLGLDGVLRQREDEHVASADLFEDGAPPGVAAGEALVQPHLLVGVLQILSQPRDGILVPAGVADEHPHDVLSLKPAGFAELKPQHTRGSVSAHEDGAPHTARLIQTSGVRSCSSSHIDTGLYPGFGSAVRAAARKAAAPHQQRDAMCQSFTCTTPADRPAAVAVVVAVWQHVGGTTTQPRSVRTRSPTKLLENSSRRGAAAATFYPESPTALAAIPTFSLVSASCRTFRSRSWSCLPEPAVCVGA